MVEGHLASLFELLPQHVETGPVLRNGPAFGLGRLLGPSSAVWFGVLSKVLYGSALQDIEAIEIWVIDLLVDLSLALVDGEGGVFVAGVRLEEEQLPAVVERCFEVRVLAFDKSRGGVLAECIHGLKLLHL